jgi:hypothetical protein
MDGISMKKIITISLILLVIVLGGCNYPASQEEAPKEPEDSMATEIAQILTGTPVIAEPTPTQTEALEETEIPPTSTPMPTEVEPEDTPEPTPTNTVTIEPTPTFSEDDPAASLGNPDWVDDMEDGDNWDTATDKYATVTVNNGFLKLTTITSSYSWRHTWPFLSNFYYEASMQAPDCEGSDHYGLMFRVPANANANKGYLFGVTCDGRYSLRRWDGQTMYFPINWTASNAIVVGEGAVNKLGVMARDSTLAIYVNGQKVDEVTDNAYLEGTFGVYAQGVNTEDFTVWVDQVRYWENP